MRCDATRFACSLLVVALVGSTVGLVGVGCSEGLDDADAVTEKKQPRLGHIEGAVDNPTVQCLSPSDFQVFELGSGQTVTPVAVTFSTNAAEDLTAGILTLALFDGQTPLTSQQTDAPMSVDLAYGEHSLTLALLDDQGQPLGGDQTFCTIQVRVTQACLDDSDCADSYPCSTTSCEPGGSGFVCSFGPPPYAGCCVSQAQCTGGSSCDLGANLCVECTDDSGCDDQNSCTTDSCDAGSCVNVKDNPACCDCNSPDPVESQCGGGGTCFQVSCDCAGDQCQFDPVDSPSGQCCETGDHVSCNDEDPCTEDSCVANVCRNTQVLDGSTGCCTEDSQCDDGNLCTFDACNVNTDTCEHAFTGDPTCCAGDQDCDDGDPTTWNTCVNWQCVDTNNFEYCVPPDVSQVVIHELMINPESVSDGDGEWIELLNRTDGPIDISGWTLTQLGAGALSVVISPDAALIIPADGYAVLCNNGDPAVNGGIDCAWQYPNSIDLANDGGSVVLEDGAGQPHDEVGFDGGPNFPNPAGASIALVNWQDDNELGGSWHESTTTIPGSTDQGTPGAANDDVFEIFEMAQCHENPNDDVCTIDTCVDNSCAHIELEGCCNIADDCFAPDACKAPTCVEHGCGFEQLEAPGCCLSDADCDDSVQCTIDRCIANTCQYGPEPSLIGSTCCNADTDCPGTTNSCLAVACDIASHTCSSPEVVGNPGCCTTDTYPSAANNNECDDGDSSTVDTCKDFQCLSIPDPSFCDAQPGEVGINNCHLDGNPCTDDSCDTANNQCLFNPLANCCQGHADCFDGNPCTEDQCNIKVGQCTFPQEPGCCLLSQEAGDCDDGSSCTTDQCVNIEPLPGTPGEFFGMCRNTKEDPTCCASNIECSDGNACSVDICDIAASTCSHTQAIVDPGQQCCDGTLTVSVEQQCDDGNACTVPSCSGDNVCVFEALPDNGFGACCDLNSGTSEGEQCDDGSACTQDLCILGRCRNVIEPGAECCAVDADCDDGDTCTTDACAGVGGALICVNAPVICDDGLFCNGAETCVFGTGCGTIPGSAPELDDGLPCTNGLCDEGSDKVLFFPNDGFCVDGDACTIDTCDLESGCINTAPEPPADDGVPCTTQVCDPSTGEFSNIGDDGQCDDGKSCNGSEVCDASAGCVPGPGGSPADDGIVCTIDSCDDGGQTVHLPENSLCDDGLLCTADSCHVTNGCENPLLDGFCLIDGTCWGPATTNPLNGCEICEPSISQTSWSAKAAAPEVCNGEDDDCDGLIDEDVDGDTLVQACANSCGDSGVQLCNNGGWDGCSAPSLEEICDDGLDNNCDGIIDGPFCGKPGVEGVELRFLSTLGEANNIATDVGGGKYATAIYDLVNPNGNGTVHADAYGSKSANVPFGTAAATVVDIEVVSMREVLYSDNAEARFAVQVRDAFGRPAESGTLVTVIVSGLGIVGVETQTTCTTDSSGRCVAIWIAPEAAFEQDQELSVTTIANAVAGAPKTISVVTAADPLALPSKTIGIELPQTPLFTGQTFTVPVYINTGNLTLGSYNVHMSFNPLLVSVGAVQAGSCSAFGSPISNLTAGANTSGLLTFNAIKQLAEPCAIGQKVHVANITFSVKSALIPDDPASEAAIGCTCKNAFDDFFNNLCSDAPCEVAGDGAQQLGSGVVTAWSPAVKGILARTDDSVLLNWGPVTDTPEDTQIQVTAYRRDFSTTSVAADAETSFAPTNPAVVNVSNSGKLTPGGAAGETTVAVSHLGSVSTVKLRVLQPGPVELILTDGALQLIDGAVTPAQVQLRQDSGFAARVQWNSEAGLAFEQDVTDRFDTVSQVSLPPQLAYDFNDKVINGQTEGSYSVSLKTGGGTIVATASLDVGGADATCTSLSVVAPCEILLSKFEPDPTPVTVGEALVEAQVSAYMNTYQQTCQAQVYAHYDDGTRQRITGSVGLTVSSGDDAVATSTNGGLLTAFGPGLVDINAAWSLDGATLCSGTAPLLVELPAATGISVSPPSLKLALGSNDPAATLKGLSSSQQLTVTVHYEDGSSLLFSTHPSTSFDSVTLDPSDLFSTSPTGFVQATGGAEGTAQLQVSVGLYPGLAPVTVDVEVVTAAGLSAEVYEPFSPTNPRVTDHKLSFIEGTTIRQDGTYEVLLDFTDGSTLDVTDEAGLGIDVFQPGTTVQQTGIVAFEPLTRRVSAGAPGSVDLVFEYAGKATSIPGFTVATDQESLVFLVVENPITTFAGVKDTGKLTIKVWGMFNDGTRRRFFDSRFIPGLLTYTSSNPLATTVDANGVATIHGNAPSVFTVDVTSTVDIGGAFDPPMEYGVDCNLLPSCGDLDFGDTIGLAFKDRGPGETFTLEARFNTCDQALGAFQVAMTHDPSVLQVVDVDAKGATVGNVFTANWLVEPGTVDINGTIFPSIQKGDALVMFDITYLSLKGGDGISEMAGDVLSLVAYDSVTAIGLPTPRALVAGVGDLDPTCFEQHPADFNQDCAVDARDLLYVQQVLAGSIADPRPLSLGDLSVYDIE